MSLTEDIQTFCNQLVLGDFEEEPSNAAMIVGGLISLIPIVGQIMAVRDVCGMVFRINTRGATHCKTADWVDLALAAIGCVPEVGSVFKTVVKPLWKERTPLKVGTQRGQYLIEGTLGQATGAAIKFYKTFNWASNAQLAVQQVNQALDLCDQFLGELTQPHYWVPAGLAELARHMRPRLAASRADIGKGVHLGMNALHEFVDQLLGEDGVAVAREAAAVAAMMITTADAAASHSGASAVKPGSASRRGEGGHAPPAAASPVPRAKAAESHPEQATVAAPHGQVGGSERSQQATQRNGTIQRITRATGKALKVLSYPARGLAGEHIADYHHMKTHLHANGAWPHGKTHQTGGQWAGAFPRAMVDGKRPERAVQIVQTDLVGVTTAGLDTSWRASPDIVHFVEAKTTMNYHALAGAENGVGPAPATLSGRHAAVWYLLKDTKTKGMQMSDQWVKASRPPELTEQQWQANRNNRFVHLVVLTPSDTRAFSDRGHKAPMPNEPSEVQLIDTGQHVIVAAKVLVNQADENDMKVQDEHKTAHLVTDTFVAKDIDAVNARREISITQSRKTGSKEKEQPVPDRPSKKSKTKAAK